MLKFLANILASGIKATFLASLFWKVAISFQQGDFLKASIIFGILIFLFLFFQTQERLMMYDNLKED